MFLVYQAIVLATPSPEDTLRVSLPAGTITGPSSDPWISDGWLLTLPGNSWTFTLRINETSNSFSSYDTHLVIAFNHDGYDKMLSVTVASTMMPKSTFQYGTPKPYDIWTWPAGDIYDTWFNDTLVNLGTVPPKGYIDVTVSVTFSDATNARIHFDAYGSRVYPPHPSVPGQIVRSSLSSDSTVMSSGVPLVVYGPSACFTEYPESPYAGQMMTFDASCSQPGFDGDSVTQIMEYRWDFDGDGFIDLVTSSPTATYTYITPGTYTVSLTVYAPSIGYADPSYVATDIFLHDKIVQAHPPPSVGGIWAPINKFNLLAPWISLASLMSITTALIIHLKHRKKRRC
jgi:PKD repeat protein